MATVRELRIEVNTSGNAVNGLSNIQTKLSGIGSIAKSAAIGGVALLASGLVGLGAGVVGFTKAGLGMNNAIEQASAKINAFTKDGEKTTAILDMVQERAKKTPFAFEEMASATAGLMSSAKATGLELESLIETAEVLAASNPAQGLEGAAYALREAVGGDFTSVIERFDLPRQLIKKLKDEGLPSIEIVRQAMLEMGYDTDLVAQMANTAEGRWSTFKDTIVGVAGIITQPIFDKISAGLQLVNDWFAKNEKTINSYAEVISGFVSGALASFIDGIISGSNAVVSSFNDVYTNLSSNAANIGDVFNNLLNIYILPKLEEWKNAFIQWAVDVYARLPSNLANITATIGEWIKTTGQSLPQKFIVWRDAVIGWIAEASKALPKAAMVLVTTLLAWVYDSKTQQGLFDAAEGITSSIITFAQNKFTNVDEVGSIIRALIQTIGIVIGALLASLIILGGTIIAGIVSGILKAIGIDLKPATFSELKGVLEGMASNLTLIAKKLGQDMMRGLADGIHSGIGWIKNAALKAAREAMEAARDLLRIGSPSKAFADIGKQTMQGFALGITNAQDLAQKSVNNALQFNEPRLAGGAVGLSGNSVNVYVEYRPVVSTADEFELERILKDVVKRIK